MKKIKLLFMALLLPISFIGCDGSSSSSNDGGSSYTGPDCPISATDFTWERIKIEKVTELVNSEVKDIIKYNYKINLKDNSKMEYINSGLVRWDAYNTYVEMGYTETNPQVFNEGLPTIIWNVYEPAKSNGSYYDKKVVFYHNNKQCGEALILSPNNTQCDIPITDSKLFTKIYGANQVPNIIITIDKSYSDNIKDIYIQFDNGFKMIDYNEKIEGDNTQYYFNGNLNQDTFEKYFKTLNGFYFYLDVVVTKNDNSQCIKEILIRN